MPVYKTADELVAKKPWLLTTKKVHELTGIRRATVQRYCRTGELKAILRQWRYGTRLRTAWIIHVDDLRAYLTRVAVEQLIH